MKKKKPIKTVVIGESKIGEFKKTLLQEMLEKKEKFLKAREDFFAIRDEYNKKKEVK